MQPRSNDVGANGVTLRVWEWDGARPGALLLHGIGNYGRFWDLVAREVAGRLRLVAPDARGHGDSAKPARGYRGEDYVRDAIGVAGGPPPQAFVLRRPSTGPGDATR